MVTHFSAYSENEKEMQSRRVNPKSRKCAANTKRNHCVRKQCLFLVSVSFNFIRLFAHVLEFHLIVERSMDIVSVIFAVYRCSPFNNLFYSYRFSIE